MRFLFLGRAQFTLILCVMWSVQIDQFGAIITNDIAGIRSNETCQIRASVTIHKMICIRCCEICQSWTFTTYNAHGVRSCEICQIRASGTIYGYYK